MNILVSTLLLTIVVFLHFDELSAMNRRFAKSAYAPGELVHGCSVVKRNPEDGESHRTVFFGMIPIQVWYTDETRRNVQKMFFPNCRIPKGPFFIHNNFLIRYANVEGVLMVAFVNQDGTLMGVRTPESITDKRSMKPTPTVWFIHYFQNKFKLAVDPSTKTVYDISLKSGNVHNANHGPEPVEIAGIKFKVFRDQNFKVMGAELDHPYIYNVG